MSAFLILSDIHANYEALAAVFKHAEQQHGSPDAIWCLGDLVGYGPDPGPCIDLLLERRKTTPLRCIKGNHDEGLMQAAQGRSDSAASQEVKASWHWSYEQLKAADREAAQPRYLEFLQSLPERVVLDDLPQPVLLVHAAPQEPLHKYLILPSDIEASMDAFEQRICFFGHTHLACYFLCDPGRREVTPRLFDLEQPDPIEIGDSKVFINPGAVGQPRWGRIGRGDGPAAGTYRGVRDPSYLWVELWPDRCAVWCHFVPYDPEQTIEKLRGLRDQSPGFEAPDRWIRRLREGLR